jgi:hypothetical protein
LDPRYGKEKTAHASSVEFASRKLEEKLARCTVSQVLKHDKTFGSVSE